MTFSNLDKTFTIRQILRQVKLVLIALALLYFCLFVRRHWDVDMGGVGVGTSPYKHIIPKQCMNYLGAHAGRDSQDPLAHQGFMAFQPRTFVLPIETLESSINCIGYEILTGLHGDHWASYRNIYTGKNGEPLVIETVEYHTEQQPHNFTQRR